MLSAYERWTWDRCRERILSLKHRLGYDERLWVLGFELLESGRIVDPFHDVQVFDPADTGPANTVSARYGAIPEMYCILSSLAAADEIPLSEEPLSLAALDPVRRSGLTAQDCAALLHYSGQDFATLQAAPVPLFGARLAYGDFAFQVYPLPRVPVTLILWRGDEKMADGGTLLFDRSAAHYLPGLLVELAWLTVWRLRNILDPGIKWGYHQLATRV